MHLPLKASQMALVYKLLYPPGGLERLDPGPETRRVS